MRKLLIRIARVTPRVMRPKGYSPFARCRSSELEMTCTDPCHPGAGLAARAARPQIKGWLERLPEVAAEDRHRIRAKPPIENLRIHCAEICFARTSPPLFSSVGLDGLGSRDAAVP